MISGSNSVMKYITTHVIILKKFIFTSLLKHSIFAETESFLIFVSAARHFMIPMYVHVYVYLGLMNRVVHAYTYLLLSGVL